MKKVSLFTKRPFTYLLLLSFFIIVNSCKKDKYTEETATQNELDGRRNHGDFKFKGFIQVNLVANNSWYGALRTDSTLKNPWGLAFSAGGVAWTGSQAGHVSNVYNSEGATALGPVHIPSPGGPEGGNPTGTVVNPVPATDFLIPSGNGTPDAGSRFIFVGVDGVVSAWNPTWGTHSYAKFNNVVTSAYTGLTLASYNGANHLYAADFRAGKITVWDKNWNPVALSFKDWRLPKGYSPFNIQVVGDQLYVTYAKVGRDGRSQAGKGKGIVNIFTTGGKLIRRFAEEDKLNAPWGVAMVPSTFFPQRMDPDDDDNSCDHIDAQSAILIGNFGDGRINIYSLRGKFLGQLKAKKRVLEIDGLWAISLPPLTSTINQKRLYFCAGPNKERDGIFGYVIQDSTAVTHHVGGGGNDY